MIQFFLWKAPHEFIKQIIFFTQSVIQSWTIISPVAIRMHGNLTTTFTCLFTILLNCVGSFTSMTMFVLGSHFGYPNFRFKLYLHLLIITPTQKFIVYLVGYEGWDPVFSSVGVNEDVVLSPQCFGPCPGCDGLLQGLAQKLGPWVHTERLDGRLSAFTVYIYLEWTSLTE